MKITVIGGGNIGTLMAAELAWRGNDIVLYTSKPEVWSDTIDVLDEEQNVLMAGKPRCITSDLEQAVRDAEMVLITLPAEMFADFGKKIALYVKKGQMIGIVPGSGGAEFAFYDIIKKGCILFGLQRVHSIARLEEYGRSVHMLGRKKRLELGTIPPQNAKALSSIVEELFDMPCVPLPNYLCVTLTPSNSILHTSRLYSMFKDYVPGVVYSRNYLFYEEWTSFASEILLACDEELQRLCDVIPMDLKTVMPLKDYYESPTVDLMTEKIAGIKAFKGLRSPMIEREDGWLPDFQSRYFSTDFPYGLKIIRDLAAVFGVNVPNIAVLWNWYTKLDGENARKAFRLEMKQDELLNLYTGYIS